jgi:hypothetical protein
MRRQGDGSIFAPGQDQLGPPDVIEH